MVRKHKFNYEKGGRYCSRLERLSLGGLLDQRAGGFMLIGIVGHAITKFNNDPAFKMVRRGKKINL